MRSWSRRSRATPRPCRRSSPTSTVIWTSSARTPSSMSPGASSTGSIPCERRSSKESCSPRCCGSRSNARSGDSIIRGARYPVKPADAPRTRLTGLTAPAPPMYGDQANRRLRVRLALSVHSKDGRHEEKQKGGDLHGSEGYSHLGEVHADYRGGGTVFQNRRREAAQAR